MKTRIIVTQSRYHSCNGIAEYFRQLHFFLSPHMKLNFLFGNATLYERSAWRFKTLSTGNSNIETASVRKYPEKHSRFSITRFCIKLFRYSIGNPCVFYTHSFFDLCLLLIFTRLNRGHRIIHMFHMTPKEKTIKFINSRLMGLLENAKTELNFIAISSELTRIIKNSNQIDKSAVIQIPHGVDRSKFRSISDAKKKSTRENLALSKEKVILLIVGRVTPQKGHDFLAQSISMLKAEIRNRIQVVCVGEGSNWGRDNFAKHELTELTVFTGETDPLPYYQCADIFVLSSRHEGFPLSCIEAMACGLPIIRSRVGGFEDQVKEGVNGFGFENGDTKDLASLIERLVVNNKMRKAMSSESISISKTDFNSVETFRQLRNIIEYQA